MLLTLHIVFYIYTELCIVLMQLCYNVFMYFVYVCIKKDQLTLQIPIKTVAINIVVVRIQPAVHCTLKLLPVYTI